MQTPKEIEIIVTADYPGLRRGRHTLDPIAARCVLDKGAARLASDPDPAKAKAEAKAKAKAEKGKKSKKDA